MSNFINLLLKRLYWAMLITWVVVTGIGIAKSDLFWTVGFLRELAPYALGLVGLAVIHWSVLYYRELKDETE